MKSMVLGVRGKENLKQRGAQKVSRICRGAQMKKVENPCFKGISNQNIIEENDEEYEAGTKRRRETSQSEKRFKSEPDPSGIFFGLSTAGIIYDLACKMNRASNDML